MCSSSSSEVTKALVFSLMTLLPAIGGLSAESCEFPAAWYDNTWWLQNDHDVAGRMLFRQFGLAYEMNMELLNETALGELDRSNCTDSTTENGTFYYVRHLETDSSIEECIKGSTDQPDEPKLLFMSHVTAERTNYTAVECSRRMDFPDNLTVLVRSPFEYENTSCPFPPGEYTIAISTETAAKSSCLNDKTSMASITQNMITLNTCLQGNNYSAPFQSARLQCTGNVSLSEIGEEASSGAGDILIAHAPDYPNNHFYTIRYLIDSQTQVILMSLQGETSGGLHVDINKGFDSVAPLNDHLFQYSYRFQPATCEQGLIQCVNNGTCETEQDALNFTCHCSPGTHGRFCEKDIDDCQSQPCVNGGQCVDGVNQYICNCAVGYTSVNCEIDINECESQPCQNNGTCTDAINNVSCQCAAGFTGDKCETIDIDECQSQPCENGGFCVDGINQYICNCAAGYTGFGCETDINECESQPCQNNGTCTDAINNVTCQCADGFTGNKCETNINDCESQPCQNNGTCTDAINNVTCQCAAGFTGDKCETNIDECQPQPCENGGLCVDDINQYICNCVAGYTGIACETGIDKCSLGPCRNYGICNDTDDGFTCDCAAGFQGKYCEKDMNECESEPCQNNGNCTDAINAFTCQCAAGFTGEKCETSINECVSKPCLNYGDCVDGVNGYTCYCRPLYIGKNCELDRPTTPQATVEEPKNPTKVNINEPPKTPLDAIIGGSVASVFIIIAIVGTIGAVKYRMKKPGDEELPDTKTLTDVNTTPKTLSPATHNSRRVSNGKPNEKLNLKGSYSSNQNEILPPVEHSKRTWKGIHQEKPKSVTRNKATTPKEIPPVKRNK